MSTDVHHPNPYDAAELTDIVSVCAWCPELNILKLQRRAGDILIVYQMGQELRIMRNGTNLTISHGMCPSCKAKQLASVGAAVSAPVDQISREAATPVAPAGNAAETGAEIEQEEKQTPAPAASYPEATDVLLLLQRGITLVESAICHVSHGGPSRADAEAWLREAKAVLV